LAPIIGQSIIGAPLYKTAAKNGMFLTAMGHKRKGICPWKPCRRVREGLFTGNRSKLQ